MEEGFYISFILGLTNHIIHISLNTRVTLKIGVNILLGLLTANAKVVRKTKVRNTINDTEVNSLCVTTVVRCDILWLFNTKDTHGCRGMDICPLFKGSNQMLISRNVGQHAQLNL